MNEDRATMLYVFCGTVAEYLKIAPVLRELDRRDVSYWLIDSGQHAESAAAVRQQLGLREPDVRLGNGRDVSSIPEALRWLWQLLPALLSARSRAALFADDRPVGVCLVHGDTMTTLLATLIARRARLWVGHVEAGLRSHSLFHPFPEELIRVLVMRRAHLLFAPDDIAVQNLRTMRNSGTVVELSANTMVESLLTSLAGLPLGDRDGPVVMTLHRVENLHRRRRRDRFVELALTIQQRWGALLVLHPATRAKLSATGQLGELDRAGVHLIDSLPHREFVGTLVRAPFVVTDGGSIQEECAALGIACLLWRRRTERPDGLGGTVVLSRHDPAIVTEFLETVASSPRAPREPAIRPSQQIVDVVVATLAELAQT